MSISFEPLKGNNPFSNYTDFLGDPYLRDSIVKTLQLALPVAVVSVVFAVLFAAAFLGERLTWKVGFGTCLIAAGAVLMML